MEASRRAWFWRAATPESGEIGLADLSTVGTIDELTGLLTGDVYPAFRLHTEVRFFLLWHTHFIACSFIASFRQKKGNG